MKILVVAVVLVSLILKGAAARQGEGAAAHWLRLAVRLAIAAAGVLVALSMAGMVDSGPVRSWTRGFHLMWVFVMLILVLGSVGLGVQSLFHFADPHETREERAAMGTYLAVMASMMLLMVGAIVVQDRLGFPFGRSGALLLGGFALAFGVCGSRYLPLGALQGILGETGTRLLYVALGLTLLYLGIFSTGLTFGSR